MGIWLWHTPIVAWVYVSFFVFSSVRNIILPTQDERNTFSVAKHTSYTYTYLPHTELPSGPRGNIIQKAKKSIKRRKNGAKEKK